AALCRRLEGLPLSIELAVSWMQTLGTAQILERLKNRFDLLVSRNMGMNRRHHSLRAAIGSGYALLTLPEQVLFAQLSLFRGGWSLEEAEAVCEDKHILERLSGLRSHSIILASEIQGQMRF